MPLPKRIVLISHSSKLGGAEKCLIEAANGLLQDGFSVTIILPCVDDLFYECKKQGFDTHVISFPWWVHKNDKVFTRFDQFKKLLSLVKSVIKFTKFIIQYKPNIIISNTLCNPSGAIAARLLNKKHFWFIHEFGKEDHNLIFDFGVQLSTQIISATSNKILVNSKLIKEKFKPLLPKKDIVIIRLDIPKPKTMIIGPHSLLRKMDSINLFFVGQITENKGQIDAIKAVQILIKKGHPANLTIVGDIVSEEYHSKLVKYIEYNKLSNNIVFISHNKYPFFNIQEGSIGLVCSEFEALGRVTIEYMKLGIPVIGANTSNTAYIIGENKAGLLYQIRNPNSLVENILKLHENRELRNELIYDALLYSEKNFNNILFINDIKNAIIN